MAASGLILSPGEVDSFSSYAHSYPLHHGNNAPCEEAIQIFLATLGSDSTVTPLKVLRSDTIASVKMRIQACCKGYYANQQRLVHAGRELKGDDKSLVKDCGISGGEVVHLVLRLSDLVDVKVKTVTGKEYLFKVRRSQQFKYLKKRIAEKEGDLRADEQQLVFRGKRLEDSKRILDLPIEEDVVIHLVVSKSAKVRSRSLGKDIELSVTAAELDSVIDNFPSASICEPSLGLEASPVSVPVGSPVGSHDEVPDSEPYEVSDYFLLEPVSDFAVTGIPDTLLKAIHYARAGIRSGHFPVLSSEGSSGTYFMKDCQSKTVAIFKPLDEEPEAVNNPRKSPSSGSSEGFKSGILVGEGAFREVAAYLLDHPESGYRSSFDTNKEGFAGVPPTIMVRSSHDAYNYTIGKGEAKLGSFQKYVEAQSNCEDMGPARFPVEEVHKIGILDMRLANTDRNGGNILVCKGEASAYTLVPIDHGYCLPDKFEDCTFEWLMWHQAKAPFTSSAVKYIANLDADRDIYILAAHGIVLRPECARVLRVATMLLKKGAAAGLTLFAIGTMMSREDLDTKSAIEEMLETAEVRVSSAASENQFMDAVSEIMDQYVKAEAKTL